MRIIQGDCLTELQKIPANSVDMILTDLPYGKTLLEWDSSMNLSKLWELFHQVIKDNGVIALTSSQPFTSKLILSNIKEFKTELIWLKTRPSNVFNAKKMFMNWHESVLIFYNTLPTFNPQMIKGDPYFRKNYTQKRELGIYNKTSEVNGWERKNNGERYPNTILKFSNDNHNSLHPTQKPVKLFEYLIKTYTNEGDTILDCCAGSGTTAIACINTKREYIVIEREEKYCDVITNRVRKSQ